MYTHFLTQFNSDQANTPETTTFGQNRGGSSAGRVVSDAPPPNPMAKLRSGTVSAFTMYITGPLGWCFNHMGMLPK